MCLERLIYIQCFISIYANVKSLVAKKKGLIKNTTIENGRSYVWVEAHVALPTILP